TTGCRPRMARGICLRALDRHPCPPAYQVCPVAGGRCTRTVHWARDREREFRNNPASFLAENLPPLCSVRSTQHRPIRHFRSDPRRQEGGVISFGQWSAPLLL